MTLDHWLPFEVETDVPLEQFRLQRQGRQLVREVVDHAGSPSRTSTTLFDERPIGQDLPRAWDQAWLRFKNRIPDRSGSAAPVKIVDLFSGCGGMTLGVTEACRALGLKARPTLAVDIDGAACTVFARNFPGVRTSETPVEELLDGCLGDRPTPRERELARELGHVQVLLGGPPCQGHSNLNNHTRGHDVKNWLMARMVRFAEIVKPEHIIIENVPTAVYDRTRIVDTTIGALRDLQYTVECDVVDLSLLGVPQKRRRFVIVASRISPKLMETVRCMRTTVRDLRWAIGDLVQIRGETTFDTPAGMSDTNRRRVDYLFEHKLHELPDSERPDCHRLKKHSYPSVYGRLKWNEPAQTVTTGFGAIGQGRNVHPSRRRALTPHEAARLQFFPDFFDFCGLNRTALARLIGNAVPAKLTYAIALRLLASSS